MTAHEEIARLIALYSQLLDDQVYDDWVRLFAPDGVLVVAGTEHAGHEAIASFVAGIQPTPPGKHFMGPSVIDLVADDRAHAFTDTAMLLADEQGAIRILSMSRYHDVLVRRDGSWRFARRHLLRPGEPLSDGAPPMPRG